MYVLHQILIHFPIAFLGSYYALELLRFKKLLRKDFFIELKTILVIAGAIATIATVISGDTTKEAIARLGSELSPLIILHSHFGYATLVFAVIVAMLYIVRSIRDFPSWNKTRVWSEENFGTLFRALSSTERFLIETPFVIFIAILGLALLFSTGSLGAAIVFGVNNDPIARILVTLFL